MKMIESKTPTGTNLIRLAVTLGAILLSGAVLAAEPAARKPKALLIMLDGCRADALANAQPPNIERLRKGAWQPGYNGAWSETGLNLFDAPADSAPNHAAILTALPHLRPRREAGSPGAAVLPRAGRHGQLRPSPGRRDRRFRAVDACADSLRDQAYLRVGSQGT